MQSTNPRDPPPFCDLDFIPSPTPQLRQMVEKYRVAFAPPQFAGILGSIRKTFTEYAKALARYVPGPGRARRAHALIQSAFETSSGIQTTCGAGCGSCCHLEVEITKDEGALLAERVRGGVLINRERLAMQAARARRSEEWSPLLQLANRCVFLGDDAKCRVYEDRPSICRKHVVSSDPSECASSDGNPVAIPIPLAEIAMSAVLSVTGQSYASLSKMVEAGLAATDTRSAREHDAPPNVDALVSLIRPGNVTNARVRPEEVSLSRAEAPARTRDPQLVSIRSKASGKPLRAPSGRTSG